MARLQAVSPLVESASDSTAIQKAWLLIEEVRTYGLLRLQVFSRSDANEASLAEQSELPLPGPGQVSITQEGFICWSAPCEWIMAVPAGGETAVADNLSQKLGGVLFALTAITDSRVLLRISGAGARRLLAMGSGVDYHPLAFTAGTCVTTKLAGIAAMVLQPDARDNFMVFVDRSHAHYLWAWLADGAVDTGVNRALTGTHHAN